MDALIGHTGFVGGSLGRQHDFPARFSSATMDDSAGRAFDTVFCAAAPGSMFEANRNPDQDRARIERLMAQLDRIDARRMVLVSTVAVLAGFSAVDEGTTAFEPATPYGVHRRMLEEFVASRFAGALVVRLPALFGPGLKKNFLFDILNPVPSMLPAADLDRLKAAAGPNLAAACDAVYRWDGALGMAVADRRALDASGVRAALEHVVIAEGLAAIRFTSPDSRFQYYDMGNLWRDIGKGLEQGLEVLHLAPPPLRAGDVHRHVAGTEMPANAARVHAEDMRTRHAALWGGAGPYICDADAVLGALAAFIAAERAGRGAGA